MSLEIIRPTYSAVKSVNGKTGEVVLTAEDFGGASKVSQLENDVGFQTADQVEAAIEKALEGITIGGGDLPKAEGVKF